MRASIRIDDMRVKRRPPLRVQPVDGAGAVFLPEQPDRFSDQPAARIVSEPSLGHSQQVGTMSVPVDLGSRGSGTAWSEGEAKPAPPSPDADDRQGRLSMLPRRVEPFPLEPKIES